MNIAQRGYALVGAALLVVIFAFGAYAASLGTGAGDESPAEATRSPAPTTTVGAFASSTTVMAPTTAAPTTTVAPTTTTTAVPSGGFDGAMESQFRSLINGLRGEVGVGALAGDGSLNAYARNWAQTMGTTGNFEHSDISALLGPWSRVGENIAYGYSVSSMFNGLVGSQGHYDNMVNGDYTHLGVGVWVDGDGKIWTAHVFGG